MPLTDTAIRNARPREQAFKVTDGEGMFLLVQTNGSKLWRFSYRFEGRQKTISFGVYPDVDLLEARARRLTARRDLARGVDPSPIAKAQALIPVVDTRPTFRAVALDWLAGMSRDAWSAAHALRVSNRVNQEILPELGDRAIADIEAKDILAVLRKMETRGVIETAKRSRQYVSAIFAFAVAGGLAPRNPARDLSAALRPSPRVRHLASLKARDVPDFLKALRDYDGDEVTRLAVEFVMHTFVRTSEVRFALWSEFEGTIWRIPPERMKKEREHLVPLTPHVLTILARLKTLAGDSPWVFPGERGKPISENTMIFALYRMGYHSRATVHGFRSLASTVLNESTLFEEDWIERQLAHVPGNKIRSAYNSAQWLVPRRRMMVWYSDWLLRQDDDLSDILG